MAYPKIKVKIGKGRDPIELQQVHDPDLKTYNKLVAAAINEVYSKIQNGGTGGAGGAIKVDSAISTTSTNPVQNKVIAKALESKLSITALSNAISEALAQARDSGEFDGAKGDPGFSPTISVEEVEEGHKITVTNETGEPNVFIVTNGKDGKDGENGADGKDGENYVLTDDDVNAIANKAAELVNTDQVTPDKVIFPNGASTTYVIGKVTLTNGSGVLVPPGGTLADFFDNFIDEKNPETTNPSVSLTFPQAKAYEVGTKVTPSYSASLNPGSYSYGPDTGITAKTWTVTDTADHSATTASGSFAQFQVTDGISYKITAKATYDAGTVPVTNTDKPYAAGQIPAGSKSATSGAVTGYRNTFYGTLTAKSDITSAIIRGLTGKSNKAFANGNSFTITIPVGAMRVVFAYPATLRDVTSVKDVNGMNADITSSFKKSTLNVEGANNYTAISYKVYTLDFANANDTANKFTVVI